VLHDELGPLEYCVPGDDLVGEAHLLLAEIRQVADDGGHAVDLDHIVLLQL
jgi:hypothetical protein